MKGIRYEANGTTLIFGPSGDVVQVINGIDTPVGSWQSQSSEKDNKVRYDIKGQAQTPIPCRYRFNASNQLVGALQKPDGTFTDDFAFIGFIEVDDNADIVYTLITGEGAPMTRNVVVYGTITFDSTNALNIALAGGGTARVRGDGGAAAVEALANLTDPHPQAADLLRFNASTINQLASGKKKSFLAKIQLKGSWDTVADNSLAFVANHDGGQTKIGFAGTFKGVAAGFAYSTDPSGAKIGFVVAGKHVWNSATASWDVAIGFSNHNLQAHLSGAFTKELPNGAIAIGGRLDIAGKNISFDVNLQVRHTFNAANQLVFTADIQTDPTGHLNYDLKLEGTFKFDGVALTFAAKISNTGASLAFTLATSGNKAALMIQLTATLSRTPNATELSIGFTLVMQFEDGKLVKGDPQPALAAPAGAN